jgi:putative Holliday junction resolvase
MMHITKDWQIFATLLPEQGRLLGIDPGSVTIGIAMCDAGRTIASPLQALTRSKQSLDIHAIGELIRDYAIIGIVMGYPLNMDGTEGTSCQSVRAFARALWQATSLPIYLADERLSSSAVGRMMIEEVDMTRSKRARNVDKLAATYILQSALDILRR